MSHRLAAHQIIASLWVVWLDGPMDKEDLCIRSLSDHLHQDSVGSLVQDLGFRIFLDHLYRDPGSSSGSCSATFWWYEGLFIRILLGYLHQDPAGSVVRDFCVRPLLGHLHQDSLRLLYDQFCWITCAR